ncbi:MAG: sugar phosphate nucleotidyltransferase [Chloroflexota bacterium]|nr:sugar phosphate nucleotidyltransferase [Chloroflexota bacterium]
MVVYPVILAGGLGTRLWPVSTRDYPKPFISLNGKSSLFQETVLRLGEFVDSGLVVVCNEENSSLVVHHLVELGVTQKTIVLEPEGRNTAPALTLAAMEVDDRFGRDDEKILLVLPADHTLRNVEIFQKAVRVGADIAQNGSCVTFGIVADSPKTEFGYLKQGKKSEHGCTKQQFYELLGFIEKPSLIQAMDMIEDGGYYWNSGMFMFKSSVWLEQIQNYRPDIFKACLDSYNGRRINGDFVMPARDEFVRCPSQSIDYAVMERVVEMHENSQLPHCYMIPLDVEWSDVGTWESLWENMPHDSEHNVVVGDVRVESTSNSIIMGMDMTMTVNGLQDMVVFDTGSGLLVNRKDTDDYLKQLAAFPQVLNWWKPGNGGGE